MEKQVNWKACKFDGVNQEANFESFSKGGEAPKLERDAKGKKQDNKKKIFDKPGESSYMDYRTKQDKIIFDQDGHKNGKIVECQIEQEYS